MDEYASENLHRLLARLVGRKSVADAGWTLGTAFIGQGILVVSGVVLARLLGVEGRGVLAKLVLVAAVLGQVGELGLSLGVTYSVARSPDDARMVVGAMNRVVGVQLALVMLVHVAVIRLLFAQEPSVVFLAALLTPIAAASSIVRAYAQSVLQGLKEFPAFNVTRVFSPACYSIACLVLFLLKAELLSIVGAWVASELAGAIVGAFLAFRRLPATDSNSRRIAVGPIMAFGLRGFLGSVSPIQTFRMDQAVVGFFLSSYALGIYVVALAFTNLPRLVSLSIGMVAYPYIAGAESLMQSWRRFWMFAASSLVIGGGVVGVLFVLMKWLVPFFFGNEFIAATPIARILLFSGLLAGLKLILTDGLRGFGHPGLGSLSELVSLVVLVPALAIAAEVSRIDAVAWAMVLASAAGCLLLLVVTYGMRRFGSLGGIERQASFTPFVE